MNTDTFPRSPAAQPVVQVIATTFDGTRAALASAVPLARGAGARLVLLVPRVVPYSVALDAAAADATDFYVRRYRDLVADQGGEAQIDVCVCRRVDDLVSRLVHPAATVVVGGPAGHWMMSPEQRFANRLSRAAAKVIYVNSGPATTRRRVAVRVEDDRPALVRHGRQDMLDVLMVVITILFFVVAVAYAAACDRL